MRRLIVAIAFVLGLSAIAARSVHISASAPKQASPAPSAEGKVGTAPDRSADEAAIRKNVDAFEKAYNAGDAKAIAAMFIPDGKIVDKDGDESEGRAEIEQAFADLFAATPKKQIDVSVESIQFIGSELAVETGTTRELLNPDDPPDYDRYTVLHVKRDGKWQMAMARDEEGPPPTAHERLEPLAWLVGEWIDDGGSSVVRSTCRWSEDGNYLLQEFKLKINGRNAMNVSQRIGWDPLTKHIHSWVFDSEGGYAQSVWARDGNDWIIRATGVRPDGTTASATNMLTRAGNDGYVWRSTDRVIADERREDTEVKVVRKPPEPK
jgi:uncharacterized protein (TIGR02246 family)